VRAVPVALQSRMESETLTLCRIFRVTSKAGTVLRATDASSDLTIDGDTYAADPGFLLGSITHNSDGTPASAEITLHGDQSLIDIGDLATGVWDGATVEVAVVDFEDLDAGEMQIFQGYLGRVGFNAAGLAVIELQGFLERMKNKSLERVGPRCVVDLFSPHCGLDAADWTHAGEVTAASLDNLEITTDLTDAGFTKKYFRFGVLTWLTGENAGLKAPVRTWDPVANKLHFWLRPPFDVTVGDTFEVTAGCDKSSTTCHGRFDNMRNFQGFKFKIKDAWRASATDFDDVY
jgi:uncharacterized phage protein (TIGR02218 family)